MLVAGSPRIQPRIPPLGRELGYAKIARAALYGAVVNALLNGLAISITSGSGVSAQIPSPAVQPEDTSSDAPFVSLAGTAATDTYRYFSSPWYCGIR